MSQFLKNAAAILVLVVSIVFAFAYTAASNSDSSLIPYADIAKHTADDLKLIDYSHTLHEKGYKHDIVNGKRVFVVRYRGEFNMPSSYKFSGSMHSLLPIYKAGDVVVISIESAGGNAVSCINDNGIVKHMQDNGVVVVTHTDRIAASCGYMLLSSGDLVLASHGAIVGNIGSVRVITKAIDGIVVGTSRVKELLAGARPMDKTDREILQELTNESGQRFVNVVKANRGNKISDESWKELVKAKPYSGEQAVRLGLIDGLMDPSTMLINYHKAGYKVYVLE